MCLRAWYTVGFPEFPATMKLRLHFVVDPMGWLCISMVFGIWLYNTFFVPKLVLFPHYNEGHIPWAIVVCEFPYLLCWHVKNWKWVSLETGNEGAQSHPISGIKTHCISLGYYIASGLCLAALFRASTADPGRLPVDPHIPHAGKCFSHCLPLVCICPVCLLLRYRLAVSTLFGLMIVT